MKNNPLIMELSQKYDGDSNKEKLLFSLKRLCYPESPDSSDEELTQKQSNAIGVINNIKSRLIMNYIYKKLFIN